MNLNHMNKPTIFDCQQCGQRIYKNNKQYHEEYQCERKNGSRVLKNQGFNENAHVKNPQNHSPLLQQKPYRSNQRIQSYQKPSNPKKPQHIKSYQVIKTNRCQHQKLINKNSQELTGDKRNQRFCEEFEKRWGNKQQLNEPEPRKDYNKKSQKSYQKQAIKNVNKKKQYVEKVEELKFECQDCYQMIPATQSEYHFSVCDKLQECHYCGMFMVSSSLQRHLSLCEAKKYWEQEKQMNHSSKKQVNSLNSGFFYDNSFKQQMSEDNFWVKIEDIADHPQLVQLYHYQKNLFFTKYRKPQNKQEQNLSGDSCPICYLGYEDKQNIVKLPCLHDYHPECIKQWLKLNNKCPVCKMDMNSIHIQ